MAPRKSSRMGIKVLIIVMITLMLFSAVAIVAVYIKGTNSQIQSAGTGSLATGSLETGAQVIDNQPVFIIPGSGSGTTVSGGVGSDIYLSLSGS